MLEAITLENFKGFKELPELRINAHVNENVAI